MSAMEDSKKAHGQKHENEEEVGGLQIKSTDCI